MGHREPLPANRIRFKHDWNTAREDRIVFQEWIKGNLSIRTAMEKIARNNDLLIITEEQFLTEAKIIYGYGYLEEDGESLNDKLCNLQSDIEG